MKQQDYFHAVDEVVEFCNSSSHRSSLAAVYLAGSLARGDFLPGRSDIDLYFILYERNRMFEEELFERTQAVAARYLPPLVSVNPRAITCTVTTLDELCHGKSYLAIGLEYYDLTRFGRLLLGDDIRPRIPAPKRDQQVQLAQEILEQLCNEIDGFHMEEMRVEQAGDFFWMLFRAAAVALFGRGVYASGKQEVVRAFRAAFPAEKELNSALSSCFRIWQLWEKHPLEQETFLQLGYATSAFIKRLSQCAEEKA